MEATASCPGPCEVVAIIAFFLRHRVVWVPSRGRESDPSHVQVVLIGLIAWIGQVVGHPWPGTVIHHRFFLFLGLDEKAKEVSLHPLHPIGKSGTGSQPIEAC